MIIITLIVSILIYDFAHRLYEYKAGSKCVSMFSFKNKNYLPKFEEIYDEIKKNIKDEVDANINKCRAVILFKTITYICGLWIFLSGFMLAIIVSEKDGIVFMGISMFLIAAAVYSEKFSNLYFSECLETYKDKVINSYIRKINQGFGYSLRGSIEEKIFADSFPYDISVNHYYGCDYVTGVVEGKRTINLCELYSKYNEGNKKRIFCGLFGYVKTNYTKEMLVECINGNISYKSIPLNMQVAIERCIKSFKGENKIDFKLLVRDGKIYLKFYTGDILSPSLFSEKENKNRLWAYYLILKFMVDLTGLINEAKVH